MRQSGRAVTILILASYIAGCSDSANNVVVPTTTTPRASQKSAAPPPGTCTTLSTLNSLVHAVFPRGTQASGAEQLLNTLQQQITAGNITGAQATAFSIVQLIVTGAKAGSLIGSQSDILALTNSILCYAGLPSSTNDPVNTWVVTPSDNPQAIVSSSGSAGTFLPAGAVSEPTLITFTELPTSGGGPLNTKLDQYAGYVEFSASSANGAPLTQPVVIGVCPSGNIPDDVLDRLRLGHQATTTGFEVTPPADASFLNCPTTSGLLKGAPKWVQKLAALVLPTPVYARSRRIGGGVGGTAGSFSPFAPVDPLVAVKGGVGGTAGSFLRGTLLRDPTCAGSVEAPIGAPIAPECRPGLVLETRQGTVLSDVPVRFTASDGTIASDQSGSCAPPFVTSFIVNTNAFGKTGACWTLGQTPGNATITATPLIGGDVPAGTAFSPATLTFTATANAPTALVFTQQPAPNSSISAGATIPVSVNAVDHNGTVVPSWSGMVSLLLNQQTFASGSSSVSVTAANGVATFSGLAINAGGTNYQLTASATFTGGATSTAGNLFNVVAIPAATTLTLAIAQGDAQAAPSGVATPVAPTVKVTDNLGNAMSGAVINWHALTGMVNPAQSITSSNGTAAAAWTMADGANQLTATLTRPGQADVTVVFNGTGSTRISTVNSCPATGIGGHTSSGSTTSLSLIGAVNAAAPRQASVGGQVIPWGTCSVFR